VAYLDTDANGVYDAGVDAQIVPGVTTIANLAPNAQRAIFVVVAAPPSASSPPNITTINATYNGGASPLSVTDTTSRSEGVRLVQYQQLPAGNGACTTVPTTTLSGSVPNAPWSTSAIPAGPDTVPGKCIAYLIVGTNTSGANATNIDLSDLVPPNTAIETGCGAPAVTGPLALVGAYANGFAGTIKAQSAPTAATPLGPNQTITLQFCVKVNTQ
jgi:uncharacterized repeat protein (TIGR01451 family)